VELSHSHATFHNKQWKLIPVSMPADYIAHAAHDAAIESNLIEPVFINTNKLLSEALADKTL
jgi:hypothetical protein